MLHFARNLGGRTLAASTSIWGTPSVTAHAKSTSLEPKRRRSGDFVDTCPDCGSIITGETADEVLGAACACQQRREIRYLAELSCMSHAWSLDGRTPWVASPCRDNDGPIVSRVNFMSPVKNPHLHRYWIEFEREQNRPRQQFWPACGVTRPTRARTPSY